MKNLIIAFIAIFTLSASDSYAQDVTFAHVGSAEVLDSIQSYKELVAREQEINSDAQEMYTSLQRKYMNLQPSQESLDTLSDMEIQFLSSDLQKIEMDMQSLEQITQQQLSVLQERLVKLMQMYRDAVKIVAERYNITYVFDADTQVLFASPQGKDITDEVRAELLKIDAESPAHRNSWAGN